MQNYRLSPSIRAPTEQIRELFAEGMLLNIGAAIGPNSSNADRCGSREAGRRRLTSDDPRPFFASSTK